MLNPSPGCVRRLFWSPRHQAAADHKRDKDGKKDPQFQIVHHAFLRRPRFALEIKPRHLRRGGADSGALGGAGFPAPLDR